jgi:hypothetical protein
VLDGVGVVRTGGFKNLFEVTFAWPYALLGIAFVSHHKLLVGVLNFFPDVAIARPCSVAARATLLPLLPAFRALSGTFGSDLGRCGLAINDGHARFNRSEGGLNSLLAQGVSGCNVKQYLGGLLLFTAELVNQRAAHSVIPESRDDVGVGHTRELMTFLSETLDVIREGLAWHLLAAL